MGLDLGKPATVTQIAYAPRPGFEYRMLNGQFQVSNSADFSSGVKTIYTVSSQPIAGQLTTVAVNSASGYRYIRYTGGTQWVNIAELKVIGLQSPPPLVTVPYAGNAIGVGGAWTVGKGAAAATDGNLSTYFDPATGGLSDWVGLDLVAPVTITKISFCPARRLWIPNGRGDSFRFSSTADFSSDVHVLYTITATPVSGQLTTVIVPAVGAYRYVSLHRRPAMGKHCRDELRRAGNRWVTFVEMDGRNRRSDASPLVSTRGDLPIPRVFVLHNTSDTCLKSMYAIQLA